MSELLRQIRIYVNESWQRYLLLQDTANWNLLCSSMDTIGDTEIAVESYLQSDTPKNDGDKYIALYGILQVLFVQQDVISHLAEALGVEYELSDELSEIREIRNDTAGHPTKRGKGKGKAFNFTSRITITKDGFSFMTAYPSDDPKFQNVNLINLIETQKKHLENALEDVLNKLKENRSNHKKEFKEKKLVNEFSGQLGYYFEKIYEATAGYKPREFGIIHLDLIETSINKFKEALKERDILEAFENLQFTLEETEYPINQLRNFFQNNSESVRNKNDADIFTFFLKCKIDDIIEMAKEIDDAYQNEDD